MTWKSGLRGHLAASLIALLAAVPSCAPLSRWEVRDGFNGMRAAYEDGSGLDVLVVHGMGHAMDYGGEPLSGYSIALQDELAKASGFDPKDAVSTAYTIAEGGVTLGRLYVRRFGSDRTVKPLAFYELSWAEAIKPMKTTLLELNPDNAFKELNWLEKDRATLNSAGKAFINTHLADPIIYSGNFGSTLRRVVAQSMCYLTRRAPPERGPCDFASPARRLPAVAIVTFSLGSALVFDTVTELFGRGGGAAGAALSIASATAQVYMLANQLPLIELRTVRAPRTDKWLDDYPCPDISAAEAAAPGAAGGLGGFLSARRAARGPGAESSGLPQDKLSVVAFSDPNDLLTYPISDRFKQHCSGVNFANITVTNANKEWLLLFADPMAAHTTYHRNPRVLNMLIEGAKVPAR